MQAATGKARARLANRFHEHVQVLDHKPPTSQRHRQLTKQHPNAFRTAASSFVLQELCIGPPDWVEAPSEGDSVHHTRWLTTNQEPPAPCAPEHRDQTDICVGGDGPLGTSWASRDSSLPTVPSPKKNLQTLQSLHGGKRSLCIRYSGQCVLDSVFNPSTTPATWEFTRGGRFPLTRSLQGCPSLATPSITP